MSEQLFFLSSKFANLKIPSNSYLDFTTLLPKEVVLPSFLEDGSEIRWTLALTDLAFSYEEKNEEIEARCSKCGSILPNNLFKQPISRPFIVLCDLVEESYINGAYLPILRIIRPDTSLSTSLAVPYYSPINTSRFCSIRIYILSEDLTPLQYKKHLNLTCTLHLIPNRL